MRWLADRGPQAPWIALCMMRIAEAPVPEKTRESAREILRLALDSLMSERELRWNDSLYHGNALSVYVLSKAAEHCRDKRYLDRAGSILGAMLDRHDRKGSFTLSPEGIRNFFDASFVRGSPGIGCAAAYYLICGRK